MIRLDRTIGVSKLSLTGIVRQMARSSQTMTMKGVRPAARHGISAPMGFASRIARHKCDVGESRGSLKIKCDAGLARFARLWNTLVCSG